MEKEEVRRGMVLAERKNGGGTLIIRVHHLDDEGRVYCEAAVQGNHLFKSEYKNDGKNCGHISEYEKATFEQKRHLEELIRKEKSREKKEEISRVHVLGEMVADLKVENVQLTRRVHELMDDYNRVVKLLHEKGKKDEDAMKSDVVCPSLPNWLREDTAFGNVASYADTKHSNLVVDAIRANGHDGYTFQRGRVYRLYYKDNDGDGRTVFFAAREYFKVGKIMNCHFIVARDSEGDVSVMVSDDKSAHIRSVMSETFANTIKSVIGFVFTDKDYQISCNIPLSEYQWIYGILEQMNFNREVFWESGKDTDRSVMWVSDEIVDDDK